MSGTPIHDVETQTTNRKTPRRGLVRRVRDLLLHVPQVPVYQWLAGLSCVIFGFYLVVDKFREDDAAEREAQAFESSFDAWNASNQTYVLCVAGVTRSFGGREWNEWLLDTFEDQGAPPELIAEGRAVLDEVLPMRSLDECTDPGPPPSRP